MLSQQEINRYNRHLILPEIGIEGQHKLKQAKVLVIGAGGLGCPVLQYLTAAGVGTIGIVDFDVIDESNLQRQILYSIEDIGKYKATVAQQKLSQQNQLITIKAYLLQLTSNNVLDLFKQYDIIVDGSDNFATRYLVNDACVISNKPFVSASIFKFEGQLSVFNYNNGPTYRCLYPEPPLKDEVQNCSETGVIGVLPGIFGTLQANEVIKIICRIGEVLSGKLMVFNTLSMQFSFFNIQVNDENKKIKTLGNYDFVCQIEIKEILANDFKEKIKRKEKFQLIDVREESEYLNKNIGGELIPLNSLSQHLNKIETEKLVIVHCQSGIRSKKAVKILMENGFKNVVSLKNGLLDF